MFRWRTKRKSAAKQKVSRVIILRDTLTLVRVANEVESESDTDLTKTTPQDLAGSRLVRNAQRVLTEQIVRGFDSGLTWEDITGEVIEPVIDEAGLGDVARFAIEEALRGADRKLSDR